MYYFKIIFNSLLIQKNLTYWASVIGLSLTLPFEVEAWLLLGTFFKLHLESFLLGVEVGSVAADVVGITSANAV